ncbi:MAG: protein kinase [Planctomycetes bacterium]|nr:protein kinase [Planctomycetota bacterium]
MSEAFSTQDSTRRKRLGELAVEKGLINQGQLDEALSNQKELVKLGLSQKIGEILYKKNLISQESLADLLREQKPTTRRLGNFEIYEKVGQGGMGMVFRARQISMDRIVALKILAPKYADDPNFIQRFVREARSAGQFNHENIVTAVDVGFQKPYHYFAMEFVEGTSLRKLLQQRGRFAERDALDMALQIAKALDHALEKNILHRDVKPDNVMVTDRGIAKLLDMGLACTAGAEADAGETVGEKRRKAVGTPHYIAPEAARGEENIDTRADLYSLGCTLYQLLTGQTPFEGNNARAIMLRHVTDRIPDVREKAPEVSAATAHVLGKLAAPAREDRYQTPKQLIEDLDALLAGKKPVHAVPPGGPRSGRMRGEHTTGPRSPVAKTTGPRAPIGSRGTTGPRGAIAPHTTGPASPVDGDRTGGQVATATTVRGARRKKNGTAVWLAAGAAALLLLVAGIASMGPTPKAPRSDAAAAVPAPDHISTGAAAASAESGAPAQPAAAPHPRHEKLEVRTERARKALDDALALQQKSPDDFAALIAAFRSAQDRAKGLPMAQEAGDGLDAARARWSQTFDAALEGLKATAAEALKKDDFDAADRAFDERQVAQALKVEDWQKRLGEARKAIGDAAEAKARALLDDARAKAKEGTVESLTAAIEQAKLTEALPERLARSAGAARRERAGWAANLDERRAAEAAKERMRVEQARDAFYAVKRELAELLEKNRFDQASELLEQRRGDAALKDAAPYFDREKADLALLIELREEALAALKAKTGETVVVHKGPLELTGKVMPAGTGNGLPLKLKDGPEMVVNAKDLSVADVFAYTALPKDDKAWGEWTRRRGLLVLAAGETAKAREFFQKAGGAGLGDAVKPYLDWIEVLELGEVEVRARKAWDEAEGLFTAKQLKEAHLAYSAFKAEYAKTKTFADKQEALQARMLEIDKALNPYAPGLLATYFRGRDHDPKAEILKRVERQVDYDWGGGSPDDRVPNNDFSARWEGYVRIEEAGTYVFSPIADDGVRVWINGKQILEDWNIHPPKAIEGKVELTKGLHEFRMDFFEAGGGAVIRLHWHREGEQDRVIAPGALFHDPRKAPKDGNGAKDDGKQGAAPSAKDKEAYLADLQEIDPQVDRGTFGKKKELGIGNKHIRVDERDYENGLGMHPPKSGAATVRYELGGAYRALSGAAGLNDTSKKGSKSPLTFMILGDGKVLWKSPKIQQRGERYTFRVEVPGVKMLELSVDCPGDNGGAHAVWLDPKLEK